MQFSTLIITLFALIASVIAGPLLTERTIQNCGNPPQPYDTNNYTCYGNLLCPILGGVIYQPCGAACFNPANYGCVNGQLVPTGKCNGQVYDKNSYVCVNNHLCPTAAPNLCGIACYSLSQYHCVNNQLVQN